MTGFSLSRWLGILIKEFIQLKRDRLTFGMIIGVPILQLLLFGFAINSDPKHLPTAVVMADPGPFARAYVAAMANSDYFHIVGSVDEREAGRLLDQGRVQFVVTFPPGFHRDLVRGKPPTLLVEADATDPMAAGGAEPARRAGLRPRPAGPAASARAAGGPARAPALQPRGPDRLQHRARADGRDPHHDHGADDRPGHDA